MNKKRKVILLIYILLPLMLIGFGVLYLVIQSFTSRERLYYVPQANIYIKTIDTPGEKDGYILFSKDSLCSLSKNVDFIKVYKYPGVTIFINPTIENSLYIVGSMNSNDVLGINQVKYKITEVKYEGNIYYESPHLPDFLENGEYMSITIDEYFQTIYVKNFKEEFFNEIKPIAKE